MILITLGSQKFQFNRLLKAVDRLIADEIITDRVFAQIGYSDYKPKNYEYKEFLDREEFSRVIDEAEIVITHGGTGAIIGAIKKGKKTIAVPRLSKYGEHVDDHQLQIIKQFAKQNLICQCVEVDRLSEALKIVVKSEFKYYEGSTDRIIESIENFIEGVFCND